LRTTTAGSSIVLSASSLRFSALDFFTTVTRHISLDFNSRLQVTGNYSISGNAALHIYLGNSSVMLLQSRTITLSGTPAFAGAFCQVLYCSQLIINANTFSGSATGTRYSVALNSIIETGGAGATYLPGNAAGATATGGIYA
jgi:hypothetical protein